MQYLDYVQLVEERYFGNVSRDEQGAVLACFTHDAEIQIRHGDNPVRILRGQPLAGDSHLSEFWRYLNGNYRASFSNFEHFVDVAAHRCAATFVVTLAPKPGSVHAAEGIQVLQNCNFFWLRDSLIERMVV